mmetsp:Transcript_22526/g.44261  ORF Transcript_22526/g.44261 Transcript_22526/m.44261 type:complete len:467 (+) Transcript_22526:526-1926(+)
MGTILDLGVRAACASIIDTAAVVAIHSHRSITVRGVDFGVLGAVYRDLLVVYSQSVPVCICVRVNSRLKHRVRGRADARHKVVRSKCSLLDLRKVIIGITIELHDTYLLEREVLVWPDLGKVKWVPLEVLGLLISHSLNMEVPLGVVAILDSKKEILRGPTGFLALKFRPLLLCKEFTTLLRLEVKLDPNTLALVIDHAKSVRAVSVVVTPAHRSTHVSHKVKHLVQRLGSVAPKVPPHGVLTPELLRVLLLAVNEIHEANWVANEEHRCHVSDHRPHSIFSVKVDSEATDITVDVTTTLAASNGGEAHKQRCLLTDFTKDLRACQVRDVLCYGKLSMGSSTNGMHDTFGNAFTVEVSAFLEVCKIIHAKRTILASRLAVLIRRKGHASARGQDLLILTVVVVTHLGLFNQLTLVFFALAAHVNIVELSSALFTISSRCCSFEFGFCMPICPARDFLQVDTPFSFA